MMGKHYYSIWTLNAWGSNMKSQKQILHKLTLQEQEFRFGLSYLYHLSRIEDFKMSSPILSIQQRSESDETVTQIKYKDEYRD